VRLTLGGASVAIAALALAGAAQAKITNVVIVPGTSIGPVSVGETRAAVEATLGHGVAVGARGVTVEMWAKLRLAVFFTGTAASGKTIGVEAAGVPWYTKRHIAYASSTKAVKTAYAGMACHPADAPTAENPDKYCTLNGPAGRDTIFYFTAGDGEVARIVVGVNSFAG
jgi:hypothetical protein